LSVIPQPLTASRYLYKTPPYVLGPRRYKSLINALLCNDGTSSLRDPPGKKHSPRNTHTSQKTKTHSHHKNRVNTEHDWAKTKISPQRGESILYQRVVIATTSTREEGTAPARYMPGRLRGTPLETASRPSARLACVHFSRCHDPQPDVQRADWGVPCEKNPKAASACRHDRALLTS
jgi:hypothetical protein